ncbi:hypothetical protein ACFZAV_21475 [Streptomyces sp. NPDC008343]
MRQYKVYLALMDAAARQPASKEGWPSDTSPDLSEYALFAPALT